MRRRLFLFFLAVLLLAPSLSANAFMGGAKEKDDPYFYRHNRNHRFDPRLKYLQSRKMGSCLRSATGICTFNEKEDFASSRYQNTFRLKQEQKQKKIRPWL